MEMENKTQTKEKNIKVAGVSFHIFFITFTLI